MKSPFKRLLIYGAIIHSTFLAFLTVIGVASFRDTEDLSRVPIGSKPQRLNIQQTKETAQETTASVRSFKEDDKTLPRIFDTASSTSASIKPSTKFDKKEVTVDTVTVDTFRADTSKNNKL